MYVNYTNMYSKIKDFIIGFVALCGALGAINNYLENHSEAKRLEAITNRALRKIAREETDMNEKYMEENQKEVRASNDKQGEYWFFKKYAREVEWSKTADDYFYEEGNERFYLKQIKE